MLKTLAPAVTSTFAPNWIVLEVTAKYVSARIFGVPVKRSSAIRWSVGSPIGGGVYAGWKPPTVSRRFPSSPQKYRTAMSPVSVKDRTCES